MLAPCTRAARSEGRYPRGKARCRALVSLPSGIPIEEISRLVGHKSTVVTELVYRKQIRPVLQSGAAAIDQVFRQSR